MIDIAAIKARFETLAPYLDERARRLLAATEARAAGRGGVTAVSAATGVARSTIGRGLTELRTADARLERRVRRPGGGRRPKIETEPGLLAALEELVQSAIRGDPEAALLWVSRSQRHLAGALAQRGFTASQKLVGRLLRKLGFSLQANKKTLEGASHPDRDTQFEHINEKIKQFQAAGQAAISVDTKKKELVGDFKNGGRELRPKGGPEPVRVHDFKIPELGKVAPYGVYDITNNSGWVNVGIDHDTAAFAVESIRRWWNVLGKSRYPGSTGLLITADCGGSNGARVRLWKRELQSFANETGLAITVAHHPPGTSKWNRIEHRLFAFITQNWRGKPLVSHEVIVQLIGATTTANGLDVQCCLDENDYPKAIKITDPEMNAINIDRDPFHGEWNYTISPTSVVSDSAIAESVADDR
ncbi:ISAzo13 family transposase [Rhizobium leguminosarum]|uniref:ISAzo13 family transposase n=1 Tax=Rhizobium leguminosarum TaxID=384 RepID=UPI001AE74AC5|nr:ISAzo13 family transposase [Rhizobium leguminosarum]